MKGFIERLIGDAAHFTFEHRIFNFGLFLAICLTFFGAVMDLYYYQVDVLADFVFLGCWSVSYYFSRFRGYFEWVSVVSFGVFVFAFFPYNWIYNSGSSGVLPYYTILFTAVVSIVLAGRFRTLMVLSVLAVAMLLIGRDAFIIGSLGATLPSFIRLSELLVHLSVIMAAMAVLIIAYSNIYMKEKARNEAYARAIEEHYHQQLYYMENLEQLIHKLKSERHDFNNHLGVIYGLLEGGETDEARRYARQLVKTDEEYQNITNIPYSMVRAMLNYKLSAARESEIGLRLKINLPEGLNLNEFDLTVILGNLLDNAMETCATIEEEKRRFIDLSILYKPDYLIVQVENPVNEKLAGRGGISRTTKPDAGNHGFGLSNIEYLVSRHNGFIKIEPEKGVFKVNIALLAETLST